MQNNISRIIFQINILPLSNQKTPEIVDFGSGVAIKDVNISIFIVPILIWLGLSSRYFSFFCSENDQMENCTSLLTIGTSPRNHTHTEKHTKNTLVNLCDLFGDGEQCEPFLRCLVISKSTLWLPICAKLPWFPDI